MTFTSLLNLFLGILTILGLALALVLLVHVVFPKISNKLIRLAEKHALFVGFVVTLASVVGSFSYSNIVGFEPCVLCWYQRIFLFPQLVLFGIALLKKHREIFLYTLVLSLIGGAVSFYQSLLQYGVVSGGSCEALGGVSCTKTLVLEFGFVTIPLMAFTAFALVALFSYLGMRGELSN